MKLSSAHTTENYF